MEKIKKEIWETAVLDGYGKIKFSKKPVDLDNKLIGEINSFLKIEYGPDYPYLLSNDNIGDKKLNFFIVKNEDDKIVGIAKTKIINDRYAENGSLVVLKECRGKKMEECEFSKKSIASMLTKLRLDFIENNNIKYIFTEPIIRDGMKSQLNSKKAGFSFYGIFLKKYPGNFNIDGVKGSISTTYARKKINNFDEDKFRKIYLSDKYLDLAEELIDPNSNVEFITENNNLSEEKNDDWDFVEFAVENNGLKGTRFVEINLNNPKALSLIDFFKKNGYGINAIIPDYKENKKGDYNDVIVMYNIGDVGDINWSGLQVIDNLDNLRKIMEQEYFNYKISNK